LNKYWRPLTETEYWHDMDGPAINDAVQVAGFPKEVEEWIWEIDRKPFQIF
jgi:hypothetical protein